ncbi:hypothetical protein PIB30_052798 [Stylosanthes scabra]|uniref:Uncharacterized protein n=1 Tax=Stylosanthes scabra TaxID=79078 RepID=A0ABU6VIH0_9FABA|nr:hypothetical protein [Stylosanthes scabra]
MGSVFGAILIVCGLYTFVWAKSKDRREPGKEGEEQGLPIKDGVRSSEPDVFDGIEINGHDPMILKKGAGNKSSIGVPPYDTPAS